MDVQIAKESDESVTLSIQADKQLVDEQKNVDLDRLKKVMEQVTATLPHSDAKFGIHEKTNRITIKLIDRETQEVIKEIPPEKTLDLLAKRMELAGVLVDQRL
ncbi:MAG: flagellar protein FlaG [Lachnospiraceae bacterium]|nr:flagellar protein FlaG [Lachnospiraceae bacterium]